MSLLTCCLWWFVLGVLVGWLLSWLLNRLFGRTEVQEVPPRRRPGRSRRAVGRVDDLSIIEGIGPKIAELLRRHGIDSFDDAVPHRRGDAVVHPRQGRPALQARQPRDLAGAGPLLRAGRLGRPEALPGRALRRHPAPRGRAGRGRHRRGGGEGGRLRPEGPGRPRGRRGHRAEDRPAPAAARHHHVRPARLRRPPPRSRRSSRRAAPTSASRTPAPGRSRRATACATTGPASRNSRTASPPAGSEEAAMQPHQRPHARAVGGLRPGEADRRRRARAPPPRPVAGRPRAGRAAACCGLPEAATPSPRRPRCRPPSPRRRPPPHPTRGAPTRSRATCSSRPTARS